VKIGSSHIKTDPPPFLVGGHQNVINLADEFYQKIKLGLSIIVFFKFKIFYYVDHMDCKLKSQKLLVIPELATIYLPLYEFDCIIDLHCLSRDFNKEQPISKDIDTFLTIRAGRLTGSVSCIPSLHLHGPNVYHNDGYVYHI
jgi:hypothetical protein